MIIKLDDERDDGLLHDPTCNCHACDLRDAAEEAEELEALDDEPPPWWVPDSLDDEGLDEDLDDEDDEDEGLDDEDDEPHPDDCVCPPCCHARLVGLASVAGNGDPLAYLERHGTEGLVEIGEAVMAGGPAVALDELPSEEQIQAMQACAHDALLSPERRNLLHQVNFRHPDLVTSSDLFSFHPVLTSKGWALLVKLGRLPSKPRGEVSP